MIVFHNLPNDYSYKTARAAESRKRDKYADIVPE